jgi:hypothetical protein
MTLKLIKIFLINILIFLTLLLTIELFIFVFSKKNKLDCHYLLCGHTFKYKTNIHKNIKNYKILYERDEYGFRDRHKELKDIDVLVLGGSTTDQRYLKDEDTWINQLQKKLKVYHNKDIDIVNSGIDGQSTFGHLWNFENWYNELSSFSPKYLIFYIGINEQIYLSPKEIEKARETFDNKKNFSDLNVIKKIKYILKKNNGVIYQSYKIFRGLKSENYNEVSHSINRKKTNYKNANNKILININSKKNFLDNLNLLYNNSLGIKAIPIFITQKTIRSKKINNQILSINGLNYFLYEQQISNIIINFCKEKNMFCINLNESFNLSANDTYDLIHLSPEGSKKLSEFLFERLKYKLKF